MNLLKQSTAATRLIGPVLDSAGAVYTSAVIGDFNITKNGTTAAMASAAAVTHSHNGHYLLDFTTGNVDTLGALTVSCNKATYAMPPARFTVLAAAAFDTVVTNGTLASTTSGRTIATDSSGRAEANVTQFGGTNGTFSGGRPEVNTSHVSGTLQTAGDLAALIAAVDNFIDTEVAAIASDLTTLLSRVGTPSNLGGGATIAANLSDIESQTDDIGVAGAGLTAIPWNITWDAEVQSEVTDAIVAYDPPTNAEMEARTLAAASYATAAALVDVDTIVDAIKLKTDNLPSDPADASDIAGAFSTVNTKLDSIDDYLDTELAALTLAVSSLFTTALTESYRSAGTAPTLAQAVFETLAHLGDSSISGTTKSLRNLAGTTAKTFTLDSATTPTSITETT